MINYTIYQLKTISTDYAYRSWEEAVDKFSVDDYKIVYNGEARDSKYKNDKQFLELLYCKFNLDHPADFCGHSLSMSDIVAIGNNFYYCDTVGWRKITKYILSDVVA